MRILFITHRYHPHLGGIEYVVKSIAQRLSKLGHGVTILTGEPMIDKPSEEEINNVLVIRWPTLLFKEAYHIPKRRKELKLKIFELIKDIDIIHIHNVHSVITMYCLNKIKEKSIKKVLTPYYHGTGHTSIRKVLWTYWRLYIKGLVRKHVNIIHTVSKLEAKIIKKDFDIDAIVIENGVDEDIFNIRWKPEDYFMYSGRIEKYKNIHRLANIVKILNIKYGYNYKLKIFGEGSFKPKLQKILNQKGIEYELLPSQPFNKYIDNLSRSCLFGLLSEKESYPQSINEANAIGVPVVVASSWGKNFSDRKRTLIVDLSRRDEVIASEVAKFLEKVNSEPKSIVPSWKEVIKIYLSKLYRPG